VDGTVTFAREFSPPRHLGVDIFGTRGAAVRAPDDGALTFGVDKLGGQVFNLRAANGTRYYGAHLEKWEGEAPRTVKAGELIGYVGTTGNAQGTSPHLHFEMHAAPDGKPVDPFDALHTTPQLGKDTPPDHNPPPLPPIPPWKGPVPPIPPPVRPPGRPFGFLLLAVAVLVFWRGGKRR
jgi:hypothetical protein